MSKTSEFCGLDNSVAIIVNFHSLTFCHAYEENVLILKKCTRLGSYKGHGNWIDWKGAQRNCLR